MTNENPVDEGALKRNSLGSHRNYRNKGSMAVVGKNFVILESGHLRSIGFVSWLAWAILHVLMLPQLQNRLPVKSQ